MTNTLRSLASRMMTSCASASARPRGIPLEAALSTNGMMATDARRAAPMTMPLGLTAGGDELEAGDGVGAVARTVEAVTSDWARDRADFQADRIDALSRPSA